VEAVTDPDRRVHLDTHVVLWLYTGDARRLGPMLRRIERSDPVISPAAMLEIQFLFEVGRVAESADRVVADVASRARVSVSDAPFVEVVRHATEQTWTRDPFDRLIVGAALADDAPLLTSDSAMHEHCRLAMRR
jgi:PIN domain nuclease of toxin-antitoxin system